jgi:hypothetical protein
MMTSLQEIFIEEIFTGSDVLIDQALWRVRQLLA